MIPLVFSLSPRSHELYGMSKKAGCVQNCVDHFVPGKFLAIVVGECVEFVPVWSEGVEEGMADGPGSFVPGFCNEGESAAPVDEAN